MNYNETSQWAADLGSGYSSIRPLGEGGMGTLYRAHKDSLDVDVVIKRCLLYTSPSPRDA